MFCLQYTNVWHYELDSGARAAFVTSCMRGTERGRQLFARQNLMPPAHPRCACAVEYEENNFTNIVEDDIINKRFRSESDPMYEVTGSAYISNPQEIEQIIKQLKDWGAEINISKALAYGAAKRNSPGTISITANASYMHGFMNFNM